MITLRGFTDQEEIRVRDALSLMVRAAPEAAAHVAREIEVIEAGGCGFGITACTDGQLGRTARLSFDVSTATLAEVASTVFHESLHHWTDALGRHWSIPHTCSDPFCLDPVERSCDPIYAREAALRLTLSGREEAEARDQVVGTIAVVGGVLAGLGLLVAAIATAGTARPSRRSRRS
jgi:hypothetical protein